MSMWLVPGSMSVPGLGMASTNAAGWAGGGCSVGRMSLAAWRVVVERLVNAPAGRRSKRIAATGWLAVMASMPKPPASKVPANPSPPSANARVETVRAPSAATRKTTRLEPDPVAASPFATPETITAAGAAPRLTTRNRLSGTASSPKSKAGTRCTLPVTGAKSCMPARKPSGLRMYASTWISAAPPAVSSSAGSTRSSSRQSPTPSPTPPDSPFASLPRSKSFELKCVVRPAPMAKVMGERAVPVSSKATMRTAPAGPRLTRRRKPWLALDAAGKNGTWWTVDSRSAGGGAVERLAMWPVGLASKLKARSCPLAATVRRHLPAPSPSAPTRDAAPVSRSCAVNVRVARGGSVVRTGPALPP